MACRLGTLLAAGAGAAAFAATSPQCAADCEVDQNDEVVALQTNVKAGGEVRNFTANSSAGVVSTQNSYKSDGPFNGIFLRHEGADSHRVLDYDYEIWAKEDVMNLYPPNSGYKENQLWYLRDGILWSLEAFCLLRNETKDERREWILRKGEPTECESTGDLDRWIYDGRLRMRGGYCLEYDADSIKFDRLVPILAVCKPFGANYNIQRWYWTRRGLSIRPESDTELVFDTNVKNQVLLNKPWDEWLSQRWYFYEGSLRWGVEHEKDGVFCLEPEEDDEGSGKWTLVGKPCTKAKNGEDLAQKWSWDGRLISEKDGRCLTYDPNFKRHSAIVPTLEACTWNPVDAKQRWSFIKP